MVLRNLGLEDTLSIHRTGSGSGQQGVEPTIWIEPAACGLRIPDTPDGVDTQSPRKQADSNDLDDDIPQIGFVYCCTMRDGSEG